MDDWAIWLLPLGAAAALIWTVFALAFPFFGGANISDEDYLGLVFRFAAWIFGAFAVAYGLVWVLRGVAAGLRWALCPC